MVSRGTAGYIMKKLILVLIVAGIALFISLSAAGEGEQTVGRVSVKEVMTAVITPATNTMWSIEEPGTDEEWLLFEQAAVVVMTAGFMIRDGGGGPQDDAWADNVNWRSWTDTMIAAAATAKAAAQDKDLDAYLEATDIMYPPCEECHIAYNPGMQ